jgi:hypothetical protein
MFGHVRTRRGQQRARQPAQMRGQPQFVQRPSPTPTPSPEPEPSRQQEVESLARQLPPSFIDTNDSDANATHRSQLAGRSSARRNQFGQSNSSATLNEFSSSQQERGLEELITRTSVEHQIPESQRTGFCSTRNRSRCHSVSTISNDSCEQGEYITFPTPTIASRRELIPSPHKIDKSSQGHGWDTAISSSGSITRASDQIIPLVQDKGPVTVRGHRSQSRLQQSTSPLFEPPRLESPESSKARNISYLIYSDEEEEAEEFDEVDSWDKQSEQNLPSDQSKTARKERHNKPKVEHLAASGSIHPTCSGIALNSRNRIRSGNQEEKRTRRNLRHIGSRVYSPIRLDSTFHEDSSHTRALPLPSSLADLAPAREPLSESIDDLTKPTYDHLLPPASIRTTRSGKVFHSEVHVSGDEHTDDPDDLNHPGSGERRMRIRHRLMANLDAEVLPFSHPYYLLLRRSLRGRNWRRSPVKYGTQAEAGSPKYIFPLALDVIASKTQKKGKVKKVLIRPGTSGIKRKSQNFN